MKRFPKKFMLVPGILSLLVFSLLVYARDFRTRQAAQPSAVSTIQELSPAQAQAFQLTNVRKVAAGDDFVNPVWSPTNPSILAFISRETPATFTVSLQDMKPVKVTDEVAGFKFFWTRDGESLVYRDVTEDRMAIKQISIKSGRVTALASSTDLSLPEEVSPGTITYRDTRDFKSHTISKTHIVSSSVTGKLPFVYQSNDQIFVVTGEATRQITGGDGQYFLPQLSPDASKVLYQELSRGLYITDLDSGNVIHVGNGDDAAWSPDSRYVIFEKASDDGRSIIASDLYLADVTERTIQLLNASSEIKMRPSWSPDGKHIAFDANGSIYVADIVGR